MRLRAYIDERLNMGEDRAVLDGFEHNIHCTLSDALTLVPTDDLETEISSRQKEANGQTFIWLEGHPQPCYSIQM